MENLEEVSLLKADEDRDGKKPITQFRPFNRALVRWALYRSDQKVLTLSDLRHERPWKRVSWFILIVFFLLYIIGLFQMLHNLNSNSYRYNYMYYICYETIYSITFFRGIVIYKDPCVFALLAIHFRCLGDHRHFLYKENTEITDECDELEEKDILDNVKVEKDDKKLTECCETTGKNETNNNNNIGKTN